MSTTNKELYEIVFNLTKYFQNQVVSKRTKLKCILMIGPESNIPNCVTLYKHDPVGIMAYCSELNHIESYQMVPH